MITDPYLLGGRYCMHTRQRCDSNTCAVRLWHSSYLFYECAGVSSANVFGP
jgi:hypothetical protein